jgi:hypothetical protein
MRAILYDRPCDCPSSGLARRALVRAGVELERRPADTHPVDRAGALALARGARRLLVKAGTGVVALASSPAPAGS